MAVLEDLVANDQVEEYDDPFTHAAVFHPALSECPDLTPDIYDHLFDGFWSDEVFDRWKHRRNTWQLHCVGGPGAGKTTFAAMAALQIRKCYALSIGISTHLASVFIFDDSIENELICLEDLLHLVYKQLTPSRLLISSTTLKTYDRYARARESGKRSSLRIELMAQALRTRVSEIQSSGCAFLILDNIDQCSSSLREMLQQELSSLQRSGLSILLTSRLPEHEPDRYVWCNFHEKDLYRLRFYRFCSSCENRYICDACYSLERFCGTCGVNTTWAEPRRYNLFIDSINERFIRDYVAWDLEREHGDLGLGSENPNKPPLSTFGNEFRKIKVGDSSRHWVNKVMRAGNGSIVQVKMSLDRIHGSTSPDDFDFIPERMNTNVHACFNEAIHQITQQPASQRELALKSIAVVGKMGHRMQGIPLSRLANLLKERRHSEKQNHIPPRSVEDILEAARGYLELVSPQMKGQEYRLATFNPLFYDFIFDDCNDELVMANAQLRVSNIPRSFTEGRSKNTPEGYQQTWAGILGNLPRVHSPEGLGVASRRSPPVPGSILGPTRSQTFIPSKSLRLGSLPKSLSLDQS